MSTTDLKEPSTMAASPAAPPSGPPSAAGEVDARTVQRWLAEGQCVLIDVREAGEHARERIKGARLVPLSRFDLGQIRPSAGQRVVLHCKGGVRSADALRRATGPGTPLARGTPVFSLTGGIDSWKRQGLPVVIDRSASPLSVMRQVQLVIGAGVLLGSALGWLVHPIALALPAFLGAGLLFAGATGTCGLAALLGRMPWNRAPKDGSPTSCGAGTAPGGGCSCDPCTCDPCKC